MEPQILQHKDARRQSRLYLVFALLVIGVVIAAFVLAVPGYWFTLTLVPVITFLLYFSLRLATLKVRLDGAGLWEPNPFRLTYVTPWSDIAQVRKTTKPGAMGTKFIGVEIVHADRGTHEVLALKMQGGPAYAEPTVNEWLARIREAKRDAS